MVRNKSIHVQRPMDASRVCWGLQPNHYSLTVVQLHIWGIFVLQHTATNDDVQVTNYEGCAASYCKLRPSAELPYSPWHHALWSICWLYHLLVLVRSPWSRHNTTGGIKVICPLLQFNMMPLLSSCYLFFFNYQLRFVPLTSLNCELQLFPCSPSL